MQKWNVNIIKIDGKVNIQMQAKVKILRGLLSQKMKPQFVYNLLNVVLNCPLPIQNSFQYSMLLYPTFLMGHFRTLFSSFRLLCALNTPLFFICGQMVKLEPIHSLAT